MAFFFKVFFPNLLVIFLGDTVAVLSSASVLISFNMLRFSLIEMAFIVGVLLLVCSCEACQSVKPAFFELCCFPIEGTHFEPCAKCERCWI